MQRALEASRLGAEVLAVLDSGPITAAGPDGGAAVHALVTGCLLRLPAPPTARTEPLLFLSDLGAGTLRRQARDRTLEALRGRGFCLAVAPDGPCAHARKHQRLAEAAAGPGAAVHRLDACPRVLPAVDAPGDRLALALTLTCVQEGEGGDVSQAFATATERALAGRFVHPRVFAELMRIATSLAAVLDRNAAAASRREPLLAALVSRYGHL